MSQLEKNSKVPRVADAEPPPRRPYHKPAVRYERVFEVQALTCGKVQGSEGECHYNRKAS